MYKRQKHNKLKLTSLMRDMYVDIPGYGGYKLNAAYSFGGIKLLYNCLLYTSLGFSCRCDMKESFYRSL